MHAQYGFYVEGIMTFTFFLIFVLVGVGVGVGVGVIISGNINWAKN